MTNSKISPITPITSDEVEVLSAAVWSEWDDGKTVSLQADIRVRGVPTELICTKSAVNWCSGMSELIYAGGNEPVIAQAVHTFWKKQKAA